MKLKNYTKDHLLSENCLIAYSLADRALGLLKKDNPRTLIFFTRWGLHTLFLSSAIDVLILDDKWRVVQLKKNLPPFRFYFYPPQYYIAIELPAGVLERSKTELGDKIFLA